MPESNAEISSWKTSSDHIGTFVENRQKGTSALWWLVVLKNHGLFWSIKYRRSPIIRTIGVDSNLRTMCYFDISNLRPVRELRTGYEKRHEISNLRTHV